MAGSRPRNPAPARSRAARPLVLEESLERKRASAPLRLRGAALEHDAASRAGADVLGLDRERDVEIREVVVDHEPTPPLGLLLKGLRVENARPDPGRNRLSWPRRAPLATSADRVVVELARQLRHAVLVHEVIGGDADRALERRLDLAPVDLRAAALRSPGVHGAASFGEPNARGARGASLEVGREEKRGPHEKDRAAFAFGPGERRVHAIPKRLAVRLLDGPDRLVAERSGHALRHEP